MKYDDIILECHGDCDTCDVYLECQYQTSSGDEKQKFLEELIARDNPIPDAAEPAVESTEILEPETEVLTETVEEVFEEPAETIEEVLDEPAETVEAVEEIFDEVINPNEEVSEEAVEDVIQEPTESTETFEPDTEVLTETVEEVSEEPVEENTEAVYEDIENQPENFSISDNDIHSEQEASSESEKTESQVTVLSEKSVEEIYSSVFGLDKLLITAAEKDSTEEPSQQTETIDETVSENIEQEIEEPAQQTELYPEEPTEQKPEEADGFLTSEIASDFDEPLPVEDEKPSFVREDLTDRAEQITPLTKEQVDAIYSSVFGLDKLASPEDVIETRDETEKTDEGENEKPVYETLEPTEKILTEKPEEDYETEESIKDGEEIPSDEEDEEVKLAEEVTAVEVLTEEGLAKETETQDEPENSEADGESEATEEAPKKDVFKLVPPENNEELMQNMCAKRGRKLIYRPNEAIITKTFTVLGTDKKNDVGEKIKDVIDAEIKQGVKAGYLDKFDGLNSAEIKEEYEDDIVYEFADQEFKKTGVIYDGKKIKVYIYDWDGKACHHVGYIDEQDAADFIPYFIDKENYSFDVCGIITGGKGKRVVRQGDSLKIVKEKGNPIGIDADIAVIKRKD